MSAQNGNQDLFYLKKCSEALQNASVSRDKKESLLKKLALISIGFSELAESGIGKAVNLCRDGSGSDLDLLAQSLVLRWKKIVDASLSSNKSLVKNYLKSDEVPNVKSEPQDVQVKVEKEVRVKTEPREPEEIHRPIKSEPVEAEGNVVSVLATKSPEKSVQIKEEPVLNSSMNISHSSTSSSAESVARIEENLIEKPMMSKNEKARRVTESELLLPSKSDSNSSRKRKSESSVSRQVEPGGVTSSDGVAFEDILSVNYATQKIRKKKKKRVVESEGELPELPRELSIEFQPEPDQIVVAQTSRPTGSEPKSLLDANWPLKHSTRAHVYSGKSRGLEAVPSLKEVCLNLIYAHVNDVEEVGESLPYHVMKPVLQRCSVYQLLRLENFNPHFIGEDDELWELHYRRDFREDSRGIRKDETWRDRYLSKQCQQRRKLEKVAAKVAKNQRDKPEERKTMMTLLSKPPVKRRSNNDSLHRIIIRPDCKKQAKSELKEQLSAHILPSADLPRASLKSQEVAKRKVGPLMNKTLRQIKSLKKQGYRFS